MKSLNKQEDKIYITYLIKNEYKAKEFNNFIKELEKFELKNLNFSFSKDVSIPL